MEDATGCACVRGEPRSHQWVSEAVSNGLQLALVKAGHPGAGLDCLDILCSLESKDGGNLYLPDLPYASHFQVRLPESEVQRSKGAGGRPESPLGE